jgi:hypothetical protein
MAIAAIISAMGRAGGAAGGAATAATHGQYGNAIKMVGQALQQTRTAAGQATGAIGGMNRAMSTMVSSLAAGSNAIKALAAPLQSFVGLRSPVAIKQFELAINDMNAAIGDILLPVWNALTSSARSMGDTYATLADAIRPAMTGIATAIGTVFQEIGSVARENAGALKPMASFLGGAAVATGNMVKWLIQLTSAFHPMLRVLRDAATLLGLGGTPEERSARGMAVRNVSIGKSGEDLARRAQEGAFAQALNPVKAETPEVSKLSAIEILLGQILTAFGHVPTKADVQNFLNTIVNGVAGRGLRAAAGGVGLGPLGALARAAASNQTR